MKVSPLLCRRQKTRLPNKKRKETTSCVRFRRSTLHPLHGDLEHSFPVALANFQQEGKDFDVGPGSWDVPKLIENQPADRIKTFSFEIDADQLAQIIQASTATGQPFSRADLFDVKGFISPRHGIADHFFDNIAESDDSFRPAKLVDHHGQTLGVGEK